MSGRKAALAMMGAIVFLGPITSFGFDPLLATGSVPRNPGANLIPGDRPCAFGPPSSPLTLIEAVERGLCRNPKTREAWAEVKARAAGLGTARAAYLPTISGNWQEVRDDSVTNVNNHPELSSNTTANVRSESLTLEWVLADFGGRRAAVRNASALLEAARATQDEALQNEFAEVAKDYCAAQAAESALETARGIERMSELTMVAAQTRVDHGVAPITDALQARTKYDEAVFDRSRAEGDTQASLGTLASEMGLDPDAALVLPPVAATSSSASDYDESIAQLIADVKRNHPAVMAARAQLEAAREKVNQTRAQGLPTVSLVAKYSRNNQPASLGLGIPTYPATGHDAYIGVQVSIPLFDGFGRQYQIREAQAEAEHALDAVDDAVQQAALDVWKSWRELETATRKLTLSDTTLQNAVLAFEAATHRYQHGVGNILELLNTQAELADARQKRVQALADWRTAKIELASKLGRLTMADVTSNSPGTK